MCRFRFIMTIIWAQRRRTEILEVLSRRNDGKAPGDDRVPVDIFKYLPIEFLDLLKDFFLSLLDGEDLDEGFIRSVILPILMETQV